MGQFDRAAEAAFGLLARPVRVELVGDVGEDDAPRAGPAAVLAGLLGRQMPARALAFGPRQRGLDQQQVGLAGEVARGRRSGRSRRCR